MKIKVNKNLIFYSNSIETIYEFRKLDLRDTNQIQCFLNRTSNENLMKIILHVISPQKHNEYFYFLSFNKLIKNEKTAYGLLTSYLYKQLNCRQYSDAIESCRGNKKFMKYLLFNKILKKTDNFECWREIIEYCLNKPTLVYKLLYNYIILETTEFHTWKKCIEICLNNKELCPKLITGSIITRKNHNFYNLVLEKCKKLNIKID